MFKRIAALSAVFVAATAPAQTAVSGQVSVPVAYGDLNLADDGDVARLSRRVQQAARQICDPRSSNDLWVLRLADACRRDAISSTALQIQMAIAGERSPNERRAASRSR